MNERKELANGWTLDADVGAVCHFEHCPLDEAEQRAEIRDQCFVVETINWTFANGDETACHFNKYFAVDFSSAIALAARMEIYFQEVAESVVGIRPATDSEATAFFSVQEYLSNQLPDAISDEIADDLPE